jgi:plastocyanin
MKRGYRSALAASLALWTSLACKSAANPNAEPVKSTVEAVGQEHYRGKITGTVVFAGTPPSRIPIDISMDPACGKTNILTEQYVVTNGHLANTYIYLKSGPPAAMKARLDPLPPVVLDQQGCRYIPHVIAVQQGSSVEFRNSDTTMHNVHTLAPEDGAPSPNPTVDISMSPQGKPIVKQFNQPELMIPVRCNNHPWMNAFINVSPTPHFAVSDDAGHFSLDDLPPGNYTLAAVHEKLGEQDVDVIVPDTGAATATFTFGKR